MVVLIQVTVQDIHGQRFDVQIQNDAQVLGLKLQIWETRSIQPANQRLVFGGRQLQDEETLSLAGVQHGSVVFMVQQNQQNQAVSASVPVVQQQVPPVAQAVQPLNIQQGQPQANVNQAPAPQVIVAQNGTPETCCCCVPLRAGALILLVLSVINHVLHLPSAIGLIFRMPILGAGLLFLLLVSLLFDGLGIYGWAKHKSRQLMMWVWFKIVTLVLGVLYAIGAMIFLMIRGFPMHHHRGHHGHHTTTTTVSPYDGSSTTTHAPYKMDTREKVIFGIFWMLAIFVGVLISGYYIRAVHRYVQELREEERSRPQVQMVNGVAYQQV